MINYLMLIIRVKKRIKRCSLGNARDTDTKQTATYKEDSLNVEIPMQQRNAYYQYRSKEQSQQDANAKHTITPIESTTTNATAITPVKAKQPVNHNVTKHRKYLQTKITVQNKVTENSFMEY